MSELKRCPFCSIELMPNTNRGDLYVKRYGPHWDHPDGLCFLADTEVSPSEVDAWNQRVPTQGADARPVAIYQVYWGEIASWTDTTPETFALVDPAYRRIVYATRDAAPRVEAIEDQPIAWGEYDTQIGKDRRLMMVSVDKESGCRVRLYDHPERDAAPSDATAERVHAIDCQYITDDDPWAPCTCGLGSPTSAPKADAHAVAEMCAKFAELYWTDHGAGKGVEDACQAIAEACRDWAVNHVNSAASAPRGKT
jgi:hypothetical protein